MAQKNRLLIPCFIVLVAMFGSNLLAQNALPNLEKKSMKEVKSMAKNSLRMGDTYTALFYYEEWNKRKPDNFKITYQLAALYRKSRNYVKAEEHYQKIANKAASDFPKAVFYLAKMQQMQGKYKDAKKNYLKFKKVASGVGDPAYKKLTKSGIASCTYALKNERADASTEIIHLDTSINHPHIEFSPVPIDENTLVYGSLKDNGVNFYDVALHDSMHIPLRKFYLAKKEDDQWIAKGAFKGPFNQENKHVGNGALSEDGQRFYFTVCAKNWQNKMICELYYAEKEGMAWQDPVKMDEMINMPNFTTTQPAIGRESKKNQEVIYFVSDRPGGKGGLDIWFTMYDKRKKKYRAPKNAGSKINTAGTEFTPYYNMATHKLYFSTDGRSGYGGLDVFITDGEKNRWQTPKNVGKPINSSTDDFDYVLEKDRKSGFFVSNREGGVTLLNPTCCDDVYAFELTAIQNIELTGKAMFDSTCLTDYEVNLYMKDEQTGEEFLSQTIQASSCEFKVSLEKDREYIVEVKKAGFLNGRQGVSTLNVGKSKKTDATISMVKISEEPFILKGILYEFDSAKLTKEAKNVIDTTLLVVLKDNPEIVIQLSSHTDNKGTENYNMDLSERRAESVVRYLILNGIHEKRMVAKGYGETQPIAPNTFPDGSDNPEGRRLNRRTDFRVIGKINPDDLFEEPEENEKSKKGGRKKSKNTF